MRHLLLSAALSLGSLGVMAQNVQVHYDLGRALYDDIDTRPCLTTTIELYKPDRWGNTFFFTDLDYYSDGVAGAYWEFARELNVSRNKQWAAHVEYDGGLSSDHLSDAAATRFQHAVLAGPAWNWASADFSRTFSVQLLYKYYFKGQHAYNRPFSSVQLTEVWGVQLAKGLVTLSGYCDLWYDDSAAGNLILQSEPQFWFNFAHLKGAGGLPLSVGTEVELSNNFVYNNRGQHNRFYAIPTVAAKWTF